MNTTSPIFSDHPRRRKALQWSVAAAAGAAGAGLAWWKLQPHSSAAALPEVWGLSLVTPQGQTLVLERFRGRPVLLNFWATWCAPCVQEMPLLEAFHQKNAANGWQVVGIAVDQPAAVQKFLGRTQVSYPIGLAGLGGTELSKALGNQGGGLPFTVALGADGRVRERKIGALTADELQHWALL
ncbi:MAG TPA: TlpA disulfide reductase family protein [Burkholderiaceae bacterium]